MSRTVHCIKLQEDLPGLPKAPFKGPLGEKVYDQVSERAWKMWLEHSKMLINEYRLDLVSQHGQQVWMAELEKFFFGDGSSLPPEFVAEGQGES